MSTFQAIYQTDASGRPLLYVTGDLDLAAAPTLIQAASNSEDVDPLQIDLSEVTFLDSTGLGALITIRNDVRERGGRIELVAYSSAVQRVLTLTGIDGDVLGE